MTTYIWSLKFTFESDYEIEDRRFREGSGGLVEQVVEPTSLNLHRQIARSRFTRVQKATVRQRHFEVSLPAEVRVGRHPQRFAALQ